MFAMLGDITFSLRLSPQTWSSNRSYEYAEHKVIEAPPVLQWVGDSLETRSLDLTLDHSFCNVDQELARLQQAAAAHQPLPLVTGDGQSHGSFVITAKTVTAKVMDARGGYKNVQITLALKEVAGHIPASAPKLLAPDLTAVRGETSSVPNTPATDVPPQQITRR